MSLSMLSSSSLSSLLNTLINMDHSVSWCFTTAAWFVAFWCFIMEVAFYFIYHWYMLPRANQRTQAAPYRDFAVHERHQILVHTIDRVVETARLKGEDPSQKISDFMHAWFEPCCEQEEMVPNTNMSVTTNKKSPPKRQSSVPVPRLLQSESTMSSSSSHSSSFSDQDSNSILSGTEEKCNSNYTKDNCFVLDDIGKEEMAEFLAWALFEKYPAELTAEEQTEMDRCFDILRESGFDYQPGRLGQLQSRRLSLGDCNALHRPLLVYVIVFWFSVLAAVILRAVGYQRVVSVRLDSGRRLKGWHRPARDASAAQLLPHVFFHGLAPAGLCFYLPVILLGLVNDGRESFLFENPNVSCKFGFGALTEQETVAAVSEIVNRFVPADRGVAVVGHSFGSVPITWLVHSKQFRHKIQQCVLLDPVTILLSEPDVMNNFIFNNESATRIVAGSELFIVHYLRRHFAWYNAVLHLENVPDTMKMFVVLSELDQIVPANKVKEYLDFFGKSRQDEGSLSVLFLKGVDHAACIFSSKWWSALKDQMLKQELLIAQESTKS